MCMWRIYNLQFALIAPLRHCPFQHNYGIHGAKINLNIPITYVSSILSLTKFFILYILYDLVKMWQKFIRYK